MNRMARVGSIETIEDLKNSFVNFREEVEAAMYVVESEMQRMLTWLKHDQHKYWMREIKKSEEILSETKGDLHRKKITSIAGQQGSFYEEKAQVRKAKMRLEEAQEKLEITRKWIVRVEEAITEYKAQSQALAATMDLDVPKAIATLNNIMESVEGYLQVAMPGTASNATGGSGSTEENDVDEVQTEAAATEEETEAPNDQNAPESQE